MAGLKNTYDRVLRFSKGKGYKTFAESTAEIQAEEQAKKDELFAGAQMPDEEHIKRNERRKSAKRRGSRISTVLTNDDSLG